MNDWGRGLQCRGSSLMVVEDLDETLESHRNATVTSYGTCHSLKTSACTNKENDEP